MKSFMNIVGETRFVINYEKNMLAGKIIDYIFHNIRDRNWQNSIAEQLRENKTDIAILYCYRFFSKENIEKGKLKSYARYFLKKNRLTIDQMFVIEDYADLPEDEWRIKMCDDFFAYTKQILIKYKNRFEDFDSVAFLLLLEKRIEEIKLHKFYDDFDETKHLDEIKRLKELKKSSEYINAMKQK